jgi:hypothetical protein
MRTEPSIFPICVVSVALIAVAFGWQSDAQTNATPTNGAPIITTNVWLTISSYREVNGQVYDPAHSVLWKTTWGPHGYLWGEIKTIFPDAVLFQWCEDQTFYDNRGNFMAKKRIYGRQFFIRHCPLKETYEPPFAPGDEPTLVGLHLKVGAVVPIEFCMMYVGTTNYNNETLPVYDCGTPVESKTITVVTTNSPAQAKH